VSKHMSLVAHGTGVLMWLTMYKKAGSMRFLVSVLVLQLYLLLGTQNPPNQGKWQSNHLLSLLLPLHHQVGGGKEGAKLLH